MTLSRNSLPPTQKSAASIVSLQAGIGFLTRQLSKPMQFKPHFKRTLSLLIRIGVVRRHELQISVPPFAILKAP